MKLTSDWWKQNQQQNICSMGKVRIFQAQLDESVQKSATIATTNYASYCNPSSILELPGQNVEKYTTLEENIGVLDGKGTFPPSVNYSKDTFGKTGYVSNTMSNDRGIFNPLIKIEIKMSSIIKKEIENFTIQWSTAFREFPIDYIVYVFQGNTQKQVFRDEHNDKYYSTLKIEAGFDRIEIAILKWSLPFRRARIEGVYFGSIWDITNEHLQSFSYEGEIFEDNSSLWVNEVRFKIHDTIDTDSDTLWSPLDFWRVEVSERIFVEVGFKNDFDDFEMIPLGTFYVNNYKRDDDKQTIEVVAGDILSILKEPFKKSTYNPSGLDLYVLVEDLMIEAKLPELNFSAPKYKISESFRGKMVFAPLPFQSIRECLQLLAQEAKAFLYVDRYGTIHFEDSKDAISSTLDGKQHGLSEETFFDTKVIEKTMPIQEVVLKLNVYTASEQPSVLYDGGVLIDGVKTCWFAYNSPSVLVDAVATNGTLESAVYYTHGCELKLRTDSKKLVKVKISGFPLQANTQEIRFENKDVQKGDIVSVDNALKTEWTENDDVYYLNLLSRDKVNISDIRINPAIDVLDTFYVFHRQFRVNSIKYSFSGVFRGSISGVIV